MPRSKRAIGDILRGNRDECDMTEVIAKRTSGSTYDPVGDATKGSSVHTTTAKTTPTTTFTTTIPAPPDLDQARRLLFGWSLRRFLETRPPSTVVTLPRTATIGEAMRVLARHGILSAPVLDTTTNAFHGFMSCLDILHAFIDGLDPSLTRQSYITSRTREQRMAELDNIAEDFLNTRSTKVPKSPDGKLVYKGHGDDATLLDVVSHGFFHAPPSDTKKALTPTMLTHDAVIEPAPPLTITQRDERLEAASGRLIHQIESSPEKQHQPDDFAAAAEIESQAFTRTVGVCHRVAVFEVEDSVNASSQSDSSMKVVSIVSQLDILRFLSRKVDSESSLANATLEELGLVNGGGTNEEEVIVGVNGNKVIQPGSVIEAIESRVTSPLPTTRTTITRDHHGFVVTAPWDMTALECFKLMRDKNVSAIGVVDQSSELVANLSASDLRRLDQESFRLLALPVAEFISRRKGDAIGRRDAPFAEARKMEETIGDTKADLKSLPEQSIREFFDSNRIVHSPRVSDRTFVELVFARTTTTLRKVLNLFSKHGIHHVYVVDDDDLPIAVLTPTDILRLFAMDDDDSKWKDAWHGGGEVAA